MDKERNDDPTTQITRTSGGGINQPDENTGIQVSQQSGIESRQPDAGVVKVQQAGGVAVAPAPAPEKKPWFVTYRWLILALAAVILIILFAPIFAVTNVVDVTETVMTPVTTEVPVTVVTPTKIKVYTGWIKVSDQPAGYYPPPVIIYRGGPYYGQEGSSNYYFSQQQQQVYPYYYPNYNYGGGTVTTIKVDYSDEIVDVKYVSASNNRWDVSLINRAGNEKVIRNVSEYDLTRTGEITVDITEKQTRTVTNQVPQQVTKQVPVQLHLGLFQLMFGLY
jgi:hypothetical protein